MVLTEPQIVTGQPYFLSRASSCCKLSSRSFDQTYVDVAQDDYATIGTVEGASFKNANGQFSVLILGTNDAAFTGTITNVKLALVRIP